MDIDVIIRKYALQNAVRYNGKATPGAVAGKVLSEMPELKSRMAEVGRTIAAVVAKVNSMKPDDQRAELERTAPELLEKKKAEDKRVLPPLNNVVEGKVVMRIAPYPSGPLHIGNAKPLILNDEYIRRYGGQLILAMDDTIGSDEKNVEAEAYDLIPEGCAWLNVLFTKTVYKSDRLMIYYEYAVKLINMDKAYVCRCDSETLRMNREKGIECACRRNPVDANMSLWGGMLSGEIKEGEAVVRLKTDMRHKNPAFRDRVLLRVCTREHPRVGTKYRVWPLLEFSWAVDDYLLGITHVLRGKDLMMESEMERFIWDLFGWKHPEIIHSGLVTIEGVKISKSKSKMEVRSGAYTGWDDPRTWSLQSLRRRGILPEAVRSFILEIGIGDGETTVPVDNLYAENRKILDPISRRAFFVWDPVKVTVEDAPCTEVHLKVHPEHPERGMRVLHTTQEFYVTRKDFDKIQADGLYRLMDCLNFRSVNGRLVFDSTEHERYKQGGKGIMHYLPAEMDLVQVDVLMPDGETVKGLGEPSMRDLAVGEVIQAERFGFMRLDAKSAEKYVFWYTHG